MKEICFLSYKCQFDLGKIIIDSILGIGFTMVKNQFKKGVKKMNENEKMQLYMPGLDANLMMDLEERVAEFEREHEQNVIHGGSGYVDKITARDYFIVLLVNGILGIYWLWSILS